MASLVMSVAVVFGGGLPDEPYTFTRQRLFPGFDGKYCKVQPTIATDGKGTALLAYQKLLLTGSDVFYGQYMSRSTDGGRTWSEPVALTALKDTREGAFRVTRYATVHYSAQNAKWFALGIAALYADDKHPFQKYVDGKPYVSPIYVSVDAEKGVYTGYKDLPFPLPCEMAMPFGQLLECDGGELIVPFYYRPIGGGKKGRILTVRYAFDGDGLKIVRSGKPIVRDDLSRGLGEPSLARLGGKVYLTLRSDEMGMWCESADGLEFSEPKPWKWAGGGKIGNKNTQQHWVGGDGALFLAYTREDATNGHVFRNRAPVFLARFDPARGGIVKDTERILVPELGARLGNFCVQNIAGESWLVVAEWMQPAGCEKYGADNSLWLVKFRFHGEPGVSVEDFFGKYVDCSIPALQGIPAKMAAGDVAGANRMFANYVRTTLDPHGINREWYEAKMTKKGKAELRRSAEKIMDYEVAACGIPYRFRNRWIDWKFNPTYNNYREWPFQLMRQPFLTQLAKYYTMCGRDEKAAETWRDMVNSWIDQAGACPEKSSPSQPFMWHTLDTGLRIAGWCRQMYAFAKSPSLSDEFIVRFFRSVREHAHRLAPSLTSNNWRIMELNGLVNVAMLFPFLKESAEWRKIAVEEYERQLDLQVYPDGFHFELSPGYHGVIPGDYGRLLDLFRISGETPPPFILKGLERAFDMYPHLSRPDRLLPPLNDSGSPSLKRFMAKAVALYPERADFRWFATDGKEGRAPDYLSYAFPYAGAVVFRTSWDRDAVWGYMDCSPFGRGHQHEDKLNVLISAYGKKMLVEGGCYAYDTSEMRKYVLSTRAHNTIRVDGLDQCTRRGWKWHPEDIRVKADFSASLGSDVEIATASYTNGYGGGTSHIKGSHTRTTMFFKKIAGLPPFFVYVDRLESPDGKQHAYEALWHLEASELKIDGLRFNADFGGGIGLSAAFSDAEATLVDMKGTRNPYQGWMPISPPGPHEHRPIPTPVLKGTFTGGRRIVSAFFPYRDGKDVLAGVKAACDPAETSFTLVLKDGTELPLEETAAQ